MTAVCSPASRRTPVALAAAILLITLAAGHAAAQNVMTFSSTDTPLPIGPDEGTFTISTITVGPGLGSIQDVDVLVDLDHTFMTDLNIRLRHVDTGTTVLLYPEGTGGSGDDMENTTFDDEAATPIAAGTPPYGGSFIPDEALAAFDGEDSAGTWELEVEDTFDGDGGTLNSWELILTLPDMTVPAADPAAGQLLGSLAQTGLQNTHYQFGLLSQQINQVAGNIANGGLSNFNSPAPIAETGGDVQLAGLEGDAAEVRGQTPSVLSAGRNGWLIGYGIGGEVGSDGNAPGLDYSSGGTQFGFYRCLGEGRVAGFFGSYGYQDVQTTADQDAQVNSLLFGGWLYSGDCCGNYYILSGAGGYDDYDMFRDTATGIARGTTNGGQGTIYVERGWNRVFGNAVLQPMASLQYVYLHQNGFTETGAGANNTTVDEADTHSLRSQIGVRIRGRRCTPFGTLLPVFRAHWMHELLETTTLVTGTQNVAFSTRGLGLGRDYAVVGLGMTLQRSCYRSLYVNYDAQFNDRTALHVGSAGLQWNW